ncbi:unnamed protein product, partial [Closterium sp. NIES-54]
SFEWEVKRLEGLVEAASNEMLFFHERCAALMPAVLHQVLLCCIKCCCAAYAESVWAGSVQEGVGYCVVRRVCGLWQEKCTGLAGSAQEGGMARGTMHGSCVRACVWCWRRRRSSSWKAIPPSLLHPARFMLPSFPWCPLPGCREEELRGMSKATHERVGWLSAMSLLTCSVLAALQFWHLKTFFERKKVL